MMNATLKAYVVSLLMVVGLVGACDSAQDSSAEVAGKHNATTPGVVVLKEHRITDPGMNNMLISTLLIPEGWEVKGGATRTANQLFNMPVLLDLTVTAPDGRSARFFPSFSFEFNHRSPGQMLKPTQSGNLYFPLPDSPGQWIMEMAKLNPAPEVSNFRLVSEADLPEITKMLRQQSTQRFQSVAQLNQTTAQMGFGSEFDTQGTKVVLQYDKGGKAIEETIILTWQYEVMINQDQMTQGNWGVMLMRSIGGPVGTNYIDDPALNAIFRSVRINPQWLAEMNTYWTELAKIRHKGNMDRIRTAGKISQIQAEGASAVNDIMMKGWRASNTSSDRIQSKTINAIQEQTVYQTPGGESVKLPSFYDHVYTDGNGRYLLHNDALYEPNRDPTMNSQDWQKIQALP